MQDLSKISVVLPSLDPDEKLNAVIDGLLKYGFSSIILVDDGSKELVDLGGGQELRFVDKNAIEVTCSDGIANERTAIGVDTDHGIDGTTDAQTTYDFVVTFGIDAGFQEQNVHAALFIVIGHLQEQGGFAGVHSSVSKVEFCHIASFLHDTYV